MGHQTSHHWVNTRAGSDLQTSLAVLQAVPKTTDFQTSLDIFMTAEAIAIGMQGILWSDRSCSGACRRGHHADSMYISDHSRTFRAGCYVHTQNAYSFNVHVLYIALCQKHRCLNPDLNPRASVTSCTGLRAAVLFPPLKWPLCASSSHLPTEHSQVSWTKPISDSQQFLSFLL